MRGSQQWADDQQRYELGERIATGGMGEVWRATDTVLHRTVAVKLLKAELADDPEFRTRFETEARHAASLHHPGIAAVFDFGGTSSSVLSGGRPPYLVMELVDGQPLSALLRKGHPMPADSAVDLAVQIADALGAAHKAGIVHRDVKPANLLVTPDRRVKITDFGIARAADGVPLTRTGQVMGTPQYLSPEQAEGGNSSAASDVYALGVVLYEALVGERPFEGDSPVATALAHIRQPVPELPATVPAGLAAVVRRCLAKAPRDRYADGAALAKALRNHDTIAPATVPVATGMGEPVTAPIDASPATAVLHGLPPASADAGVRRTAQDDRKGGGLAWFAALLVGVLLALAAFALWNAFRTSDEPTDTPTTTITTPTASETTVDLPASVCVGPVDDVVGSIGDRSLSARTEPVENPGTEVENDVIDCNPTGTLKPGDEVTVRYWGPAPEPTESATPTPTPTPTSTIPLPTAPVAPSEATQ